MDEAAIDARISQVLAGLMHVRRMADAETLDDLLGAIQTDIELGLQVAEEQALEAKLRRVVGNVVAFPLPAVDPSR